MDTEKEMYERGRVVAHSSDESGIPDVGLSVGLGNGQMLYVGDVPGVPAVGVKIYGTGNKATRTIGHLSDFDRAKELVELIGASLRTES